MVFDGVEIKANNKRDKIYFRVWANEHKLDNEFFVLITGAGFNTICLYSAQ